MRRFGLCSPLRETGQHTDSARGRAGNTPTFASWEMVFLAALFLGAAVVRLWGMSKIHSWDEMVYLQNAQVICWRVAHP